MRKFRWTNNSLYSLRLRDGSFVLLQTLDRNGWVAALNIYSDTNQWGSIVPNKNDVLFVTFVLRSFLVRSQLERIKDIKPISVLSAPQGVKTRLNTTNRKNVVTLWAGTDEEVTINGIGSEVGLHKTGIDHDGNAVDDFELIQPADYKKYKKIETSHLSEYGSLNERLLLCRDKGWNFDPMRNIMFGWRLDKECHTYARIISGKYRLDELGYTG